ncbi:MAG: hypothetical protein GTO45_23870 [Candidatus Aminicenantes bacterium]|nr:hypothetical protein [Candidatus Aminicenantes bacterium]NIM81795.1 hypothetical protein [Candidatus Aminicenantes bacterium]NIN21167.1 hypothetical protein [Candidatus Aminicenantes bacterium]NIN44991.1 hypothetical protein [Candidatus Aminicenantes bacterium]NIN87805.1 hypothetical protein [Candidatus Aminicenantes bacterium]
MTRGGSLPRFSSLGRQLKIKVPFSNWGMEGGYCNLKKLNKDDIQDITRLTPVGGAG